MKCTFVGLDIVRNEGSLAALASAVQALPEGGVVEGNRTVPFSDNIGVAFPIVVEMPCGSSRRWETPRDLPLQSEQCLCEWTGDGEQRIDEHWFIRWRPTTK